MLLRTTVLLRAFGLTALLTASLAVAQGVVLPGGTGEITPSADWTVIRTAELQADERASDPLAEEARTWLRAVIQEIQSQERTEHHVLLHRSDATDKHLQLVNCYSADVRATASELLTDEAAKQVGDGLAEVYSAGKTKWLVTGHETSELFVIPSLLLHFAPEDATQAVRLDMYLVPAGNQLQYFECQYLADDQDAQPNIQELLQTFDGAKEPESRVSNLLIGGLAGATAGILTALFRRKRQMRRTCA